MAIADLTALPSDNALVSAMGNGDESAMGLLYAFLELVQVIPCRKKNLLDQIIHELASRFANGLRGGLCKRGTANQGDSYVFMNISISSEVRTVAPNLRLGCISGTVKVQKDNDELWRVIDKHIRELSFTIKLESVVNIPQISVMREAYKNLDKDPSRYRGSAEALLRRILSGKGMYKINSVVDINNLVSLKTFHSVGSYDLERVKEPLVFRAGLPGESYKGIGKEMINVENLPVFADAEGAYGSPTSDSERAMIRMETTKAVLVVISFTGRAQLEEQMHDAAALLHQYSGASDLNYTVI